MATLKSGLATSTFWEKAIGGSVRLMGRVNGVDRNLITDGVTAWEMGIDAPASVATYNAKINGSLDESANYYFDYVYRRSIHGVIGNSVGTSAVMTTGTAGGSEDGLRIAIAANSALQSGIDQVEVYRTLGSGTTLFYDGRKAYTGSAITYDATIADSALGSQLQTDNNTPPTRPYIVYSDGHWVLWGSKTHNAGTVAVTNGLTTITFTSASITKGHIGARFNVTADGSKFYTISSVNVTAQTAVIPAYEGTTNGTATYTIDYEPLVLDWSKIDSSLNILLESWPTANTDKAGGGNEKASGIGLAGGYILPFTDRNTYSTKFKTANTTYGTDLLYPDVGCGGNRTIVNTGETGDCIWLDQNGNVRRADGTKGGIYNISKNFIANILDETHIGIHRNLRVDTSKYSEFHGIYYGVRGWYMLFVTLSGSTYPNACLIYDENINRTGDATLPSPWMLWTGFNAVCSGIEPDSSKILRPFFGDDLGFKWQMDSGTNDGVPSGTVTGAVTSADATTLTYSAGAFYTTGSGLKGVRVRTYDATTDALENDIVIQSNNATVLTVTAWTVTPSAGDTFVVGGIDLQRYTKIYHDGMPHKIKVPKKFYMTADDSASSTRNVNVKWYANMSATPITTLGENIDVSSGPNHVIGVRAKGTHHQYLISNHKADEAIEIYDFTREVSKGNK